MSISDRLDEIQGRSDAATDGPWAAWLDQDGAAHMHGLLMVGNAAAVIPDGESWVEGVDVNPIAHTYCEEDRQFVAHSRTDVPALVATLRAILNLHKPHATQVLAPTCSAEECDCEGECQEVPVEVCGHCMEIGEAAHRYAYENGGVETVRWPCPTVATIEAALGSKS